MSLREGCKEVLKADCVDLAERLYRGQRRGIKVSEDHAKCAICNGNLIEYRPNGGVIAFWCHHFYHQRCLRSGGQGQPDATQPAKPEVKVPESPMKLAEDEKLWCTICQSQRQRGNRKTPVKN